MCNCVYKRGEGEREWGGGTGHVHGRLLKPSVGLRCPGVTCACEQPDVGSENQTQAL